MRYIVEDCGVVVLSAGASSRMGRPKQLMKFNNKSLLQNTIGAALQTGIRPVIVVVGAHNDLVEKEISNTGIQVVRNLEWKEGMASSLRVGLAAAKKNNPDLDGIIFMVCDQPFVNSALINSLLNAQRETGKPLVACSYGDRLGTPALFHKSLFGELVQLKGDIGARAIIKKHEDLASVIKFPAGIIDIDTPEDWEALQNEKMKT